MGAERLVCHQLFAWLELLEQSLLQLLQLELWMRLEQLSRLAESVMQQGWHVGCEQSHLRFRPRRQRSLLRIANHGDDVCLWPVMDDEECCGWWCAVARGFAQEYAGAE